MQLKALVHWQYFYVKQLETETVSLRTLATLGDTTLQTSCITKALNFALVQENLNKIEGTESSSKKLIILYDGCMSFGYDF
jgi:hypothetical protein